MVCSEEYIDKVTVKKAASKPAPIPPPAPPPSMPVMHYHMARTRTPVVVQSVTREEIDRYWRAKRMVEEDHLLAAQKAAARIRARTLKDEDYRLFEESVKKILEEDQSREEDVGSGGAGGKEIRIGIKDWWTKSKYAYLNQPAVRSTDEKTSAAAKIARSTSTYVPQMAFHCCLSPPLTSSPFGGSLSRKNFNDL